jgi:hypothetical protein
LTLIILSQIFPTKQRENIPQNMLYSKIIFFPPPTKKKKKPQKEEKKGI